MKKLLVINGPNINLLGIREPGIYGDQNYEELLRLVKEACSERQMDCECFQSNHEGELVDRIHAARQDGTDFILINAGAYTHTSLALADCLAWIGIPTVEVHVSNVFARPEPIRQQSYMAAHVIGVISGFGLMSYALAVQALVEHLDRRG